VRDARWGARVQTKIRGPQRHRRGGFEPARTYRFVVD